MYAVGRRSPTRVRHVEGGQTRYNALVNMHATTADTNPQKNHDLRFQANNLATCKPGTCLHLKRNISYPNSALRTLSLPPPRIATPTTGSKSIHAR
jgi:hypothetical protein